MNAGQTGKFILDRTATPEMTARPHAMKQLLRTFPEVPPADVLITSALTKRPRRPSSLQAEAAVYSELARLRVDGTEESMASFLEVTRRLSGAGSAGISMLRTDESGNAYIRWESISGALAAHEGGEAPRNSSPCGLCIDAAETVLMWRPERAYRHLSLALPPIIEKLIAPLYDSNGTALGTLWVAHHDSRSGFCLNDVEVIEQLAIQLIRQLKLRQAASEHRNVLAALAWHRDTQLSLTQELVQERSARARAEASEKSLREALVFKEAATYEAHHRVKNSLQIVASLLSMHVRTATVTEVRAALQEAQARLQVLAQVHELLYRGNNSAQEILMSTLLESIGDGLRNSFAERSAQIVLNIAAEPILLGADRAIPLALVANEIMTNAYKHAFPDEASGEIAVRLVSTPENTLILQIADDGVGIHSPPDSATLGVRLVHLFAKQLHGELSFTSTSGPRGTTVTLDMPRELIVVVPLITQSHPSLQVAAVAAD